MIQIKQLNKVFRTSDVETQALNNVNLDIAKGDFVAIMGPSGCGKSTLLNIIGLLDNPTSGNYLLDGIEMGSLKESQRTSQRKGRIGFIFQSFNLIDELTVAENIELPLTYLGVPKKERRIKVDNLLQRLNLSHRSRHYPQQLSGGQQQRVAIAKSHCRRSGDTSCRRADRQPRLIQRTGSDGAAHFAQSRGHHDSYGDPLPARCIIRPTDNQPV